jgi:Leucine-rich repeat (LRR) protein
MLPISNRSKASRGLRPSTCRDTPVANIEPLKDLTGLHELDLTRTEVANIEPLETLTGLQYLDLRGTKVTDIEPLLKTLKATKITWDGPRK